MRRAASRETTGYRGPEGLPRLPGEGTDDLIYYLRGDTTSSGRENTSYDNNPVAKLGKSLEAIY